jgi:hypothetical protein
LTRTPELEAFLAAEDLDVILRALQKVTSLDAEDAAVVRLVLQR